MFFPKSSTNRLGITYDIDSPRKQAENIATKTGAMEISTVASPTGIFWNANVPEEIGVLFM